MGREAVTDDETADEVAIWHYLQWARLDPQVSGKVDNVESARVYVRLTGRRDRIKRFVKWLEEQVGSEAAERSLRRATDAARTGPPARRARRVRVVAKR